MKAILINGQPKYQNQFKFVFDINGNQTSTNGFTVEDWTKWEFKDVGEIPTYDYDTQKLGEWDDSGIVISKSVINKTAEVISDELSAAKTNAIKSFENDTDSLIREVVGERANEYLLAEEEAIAFKAGGYIDADVTPSISSDAIANGRTNTEACDLILAMAVSWRDAQEKVRANRLLAKAQVKVATLISEIAPIKATWDGFLATLRTQIVG
tara:strand:+ start:6899 stop:7531 length:633 start_codon:yes stop_codon:yes gene_type:complete